MNPENRRQVERPPLGKIRALNQEETERRLAFEFIALEKHEELVDVLNRIGNEINFLRKNANVPELQFRDSDVRLISAERWEQFVKDAHIQEDNGAFWDPLTQKCYIKYDSEEYDRSRLKKVAIMYTIAHESAHKAFPDAEKYSFHLSEGLADYVARLSLERGVFPSVLTPEERNAKATYIQEMHPEDEGFELGPEDIIIEESGIGAMAYSRIPQLRLVKKLYETNPEAFSKMLTLSFSGDYQGTKQFITQTWGQDLAESLAKSDVDIKAVLPTIGKRES